MAYVNTDTEGYMPFDAELQEDGTLDNLYGMADFRGYWAAFFGDGVFPNPSTNLQVAAPYGNMYVSMHPGMCFIKGGLYWRRNEGKDFLIEDSNASNPRYDILVARLDEIKREICTVVVKGTAAASPKEPELTRNSDKWELKLARITVRAGATSILPSDILDYRLDSSVCGVVAGTVEEIDTETVFQQYKQYLEEKIAEWNAYTEETRAAWLADYNLLMQDMREAYGAVSTQTFYLINNNFDDWSVKRGCSKTTVFGDTITETITVVALGFTLATRETTFGESITERICFYPWETTEGGNTINSTTFTMTKTTTFNDDGTITEVAL